MNPHPAVPIPSSTELMRYLNENALFTNLPEEAVAAYGNSVRVLELEDGEILYEDSDPSSAVYLVAQGVIRFLVRRAQGADFVESRTCAAGGFFGEGAALEYLVGQPQHPMLSRARIVAEGETVLIVLPAELLARAIQEHPVVMTTNLVRASSQKSRSSIQGQLDVAIEGETVRVIESVLSWLSRRSLDALSSIQINSGLLRETASDAFTAEIAQEVLEATHGLSRTFTALADMAQTDATPARTAEIHTDVWWKKFSPQLEAILDARGVAIDSYIERDRIVTSRNRLERAFSWLFEGISKVMEKSEIVSVKGGSVHGQFEFRISFRFPMLTEFVARRLLLPFAIQGSYADVGVELSLARRLVRSLHGNLEVAQRSGELLTLDLSLPARTHEDD